MNERELRARRIAAARGAANSPTATTQRTILPRDPAPRRTSAPRGSAIDPNLAEEVLWEPWNTVAGVTMDTSNDYVFVQPEANWLDLTDESAVRVRLDILQITGFGGAAGGVTFQLETALSAEGTWETVGSYTSITSTSFVASSDADAVFPLARYLRYRVLSFSTPWAVTFQLNVAAASAAKNAALHHQAAYEDDFIEVQPWTSFYSTAEATGSTPITQDAQNWLATAGMRYLALETEATILSGATLHLQSAYSKEGPWTDIATYTAAYTAQQVALSWEDNSGSGGEAPLGRYIRWQLEGSKGGGNFWIACFRINGKWT